jgi:hypothetical protein
MTYEEYKTKRDEFLKELRFFWSDCNEDDWYRVLEKQAELIRANPKDFHDKYVDEL